MSFLSPPTTSGIVVLSGSNLFDPASSDFPVLNLELSSPLRSASPPFTLMSSPESWTQAILAASQPALNPTSVLRPALEFSMTTPPESWQQAVRSSAVAPLALTASSRSPVRMDATVLRTPEDIDLSWVRPPTTSGVVVLGIYPGAGVPPPPYIAPVVINARLFPIFAALFPTTVSGERIYPVLPQFSTVIP